jgi:hypothetical protein
LRHFPYPCPIMNDIVTVFIGGRHNEVKLLGSAEKGKTLQR